MGTPRAAHRTETEESSVFVRSASSGMDLGELRRAVELAEGLPDTAAVTLEAVTKSYLYVDEYLFAVIRIRSRAGVIKP